jgi:hypothetical protein
MQTAKADYYYQCAAILANGIFNTSDISLDFRSRSSFEQFMCSSASSTERKNIEAAICRNSSSSRATTWKSSANIIDLLSGSSNSNIQKAFREKFCKTDQSFDYAAWSAERCHNFSDLNAASAITHTLLRNANEDIVQAWLDCVRHNRKSGELICYGKEYGELIAFHVDWDHKYASNLEVNRLTPANLTILGDLPKKILPGKDEFAFKRQNRKDYSLIQLATTENISGKENRISCEYAIPPAACTKPIYKKIRSELCGIQDYVVGRGAVCGVKKYRQHRVVECGVELYREGKTPGCGYDETHITKEDGGCSACSSECGNRGGTDLSCREEEHSGYRFPNKFWRNVTCHMQCGFMKTCRHVENGVELYRLCDSAQVEEYNECKDSSFGVIYKECRLPEFGIERCDD